MVIAPVTASVFVPLIVIPLFAAGAFTVILAAAAAATSTVTTTPVLMVTASVDVGTAAPPHVAVLFQLPVTEAVLCAIDTVLMSTTTVMREIKECDIRDIFFTIEDQRLFSLRVFIFIIVSH
jgi:hypothetical protein